MLYLRNKNTEVIKFTPQLLGTYFSVKGKAQMALEYYDNNSGLRKTIVKNVMKVNCKENLEDVKLDKIGGNHYVLLKTTDDMTKNTDVKSTQKNTAEQSQIAVATDFIYSINKVFQAELQIVCNPLLQPQQIITVNVPKPSGELHYASGQYKIIEISDRFANGVLQSTIKLIEIH